MGYSPANTICSTLGVISVVISAKGKLLYFPLYLIYSILYGIISFKGSYYGQSILYLALLAPMCIVGCRNWFKNFNVKTGEINKNSLSWKTRILGALVIAVVIVGLSFVLRHFGDKQPIVDASATIFVVSAFFLTMFRYIENWWIWVVSNTVNITLWLIDKDYAMVVMFAIFLLNSIVALIRWQRNM
ncbi:MAG: nicotinamide mononucleotide transporter [Bacteroidales bacterium]|nr:nicotinamide mononucleotide transporter [Bacteroidales bacterium]